MPSQNLKPGEEPLPPFDEFIAVVNWGAVRNVCGHRRRHAGREFIRLRNWYLGQSFGRWYQAPSRQEKYVIPLEHAEELAQAILAAVRGEAQPKPDWLVEHELEFGKAP